MKDITISSIGRFHLFDLALELYKKGRLNRLITGYPSFKTSSLDIPSKYIENVSLKQTIYLLLSRIGINNSLSDYFDISSHYEIDKYLSNNIKDEKTIISLSSTGLTTCRAAKKKQIKYICDRGSTHILFQNEILKNEYSNLNLKYKEINKKIIDLELAEYEESDYIFVPSEFVKNSFIEKGIDTKKIKKINYGIDQSIFQNIDNISKSKKKLKEKLILLFVGGISIRKGAHYLLDSINFINHKNLELWFVGQKTSEFNEISKNIKNLKNHKIIFFNNVSRDKVINLMNQASLFILPSLEEGLSLSCLQAYSVGLPIIASKNTGVEDFINDMHDGILIETKNSRDIANKIMLMIENENLYNKIIHNISLKEKKISKSDYSSKVLNFIDSIHSAK